MTTSICVCCFRNLIKEEQEYYETRCEICERQWQSRIEAWRFGKQDTELDDYFSKPPES